MCSECFDIWETNVVVLGVLASVIGVIALILALTHGLPSVPSISFLAS